MIIGRIVKGVGGLYFVAAGEDIFECKARGIFRKKKIVPTVGDYVRISILDKERKVAFIEDIQERKNLLIRPKTANVDICIITFAAASPDINFDLLDRFLILSEEKKLDAVICVNKYDLITPAVKEYVERVYLPVYKVVFTDTFNNIGISELKENINGKVSVFAGPSGVGKSSIINKILSDEKCITGEISRKIGRGKHTTREVELLFAGGNTFIVDSPGFTSLSLEHIKSEKLQFYFKEFTQFIGKCRFSDCMHLCEPDCKVKENIGGNISEERYKRYEFLYGELHRQR